MILYRLMWHVNPAVWSHAGHSLRLAVQKSSNACDVFNGRKQCMTPPVDLKAAVKTENPAGWGVVGPSIAKNNRNSFPEFKVLRERYPKVTVFQKWLKQFWNCRFYLFVEALKKALGLSPWQQVKHHLYQSILCAKNLPPWDVGKTFQTPEAEMPCQGMSFNVIQMIGMIAICRNDGRIMTQHVMTCWSV